MPSMDNLKWEGYLNQLSYFVKHHISVPLQEAVKNFIVQYQV